MAVFVIFPAKLAQAATVNQGNYSPGSATQSSNGTSTAWTAPTGFITGSATTYATLAASAQTYLLEATNYGFNVPAAATITGVTLSYDRYAAPAADETTEDQTVELWSGGAALGTNQANSTDPWYATISGSTYTQVGVTYGSSTSLWGASLTPAIVNASGFGVAVAAINVHSKGSSNSVTPQVITLGMMVSYTMPTAFSQASYRFYGNQTNATAAGSSWTQASTAAAWGARDNMATLSFGGKMWMMGGYNGTSYLNDVWYSTDGITWTEATAAAAWPAREGLSAAVFGGKMWIMGGDAGSTYYNDVWYSTDGITWTEATAAAAWPARSGAGLAVLNNRLFIVGGYNGSAGGMTDVWYSPDGTNWGIDANNGGWSSGQSISVTVWNNDIWVMGGVNGSTYYNAVWYSPDGSNWTEATTGAAWPARAGATAVAAGGELWLMGGYNGTSYLNDVWTSTDGITWTEEDAGASWAGRSNLAGLVYNSAAWILGGYSNAGTAAYYADVWSSSPPTMDVGTPLAAQNTTAITPGDGIPFRLRLDLGVTGAEADAGMYDFQLQYAPMGADGVCDNTDETYTSPGQYTVIRYANNGTANNGQGLTTNANDPTDGTNTIVYQDYHQSGTTTFDLPTLIPAGQDGLWDFALETYDAPPNQQYCLRVVNSDGSLLTTYTTFPEIQTPPATVNQSNYRFFANQNGPWQLGSQATYPTVPSTSTTPVDVVTADFNGDGKPDIAIVNKAGGNVNVYLNNGNGTFAAAVSYTVSSGSPVGVAAADLNKDGYPDLVVIATSLSGDYLYVYMNNGNGTFGTPTSYSLGTTENRNSIAVADFNGDGYPDVVVTCQSTNQVEVFLNNGSGGLGTGVYYATGTGPYDVTTADVNGDGHPDLVVGNGTGNSVSVLINSGTGTFGTGNNYFMSGAGNLTAVTAGDVNGDGHPDIVAATTSGVDVLLNNGSGGFGSATAYDTTLTTSSDVALADVNGDGYPDILVVYGGNYLDVLPNSGTGTFGPPTTLTVGASPSAVATADFNGDGHVDVVTANYGGNDISVLLDVAAASVGTALDGQNEPLDLFGTQTSAPAPVTAAPTNQPFRLRWLMSIGGSAELKNSLTLRLQYAEMTGGSCAATQTSGSWADVTASTPVQFYTGNAAANGATLVPNANDPTDGTTPIVYQDYVTQNPFSNTMGDIPGNQDGLWDMALQMEATPPHTSYCVRVVYDNSGVDGANINSYNVIPQVDMAPTMPQLLRGREWWNSSGVRQFKDLLP